MATKDVSRYTLPVQVGHIYFPIRILAKRREREPGVEYLCEGEHSRSGLPGCKILPDTESPRNSRHPARDKLCRDRHIHL